MSDRVHRKRRVAADEAHSWARNLRLGNPMAKLVLSMMTLYVNGEGICTVGVETLAEDCELSPDTVRKRRAWLEQIGAIALFPRWVDENGKANTDGRGRRTSDEVRLLIDADPDEIEARARGDDDGPADMGMADVDPQRGPTRPNGDTISPRAQQGLNPAAPEADPRLALGLPSDCSKGLILEPEPEDSSPTPPSEGSDEAIDGWEEFRQVWGWPIVRLSLAQQLFSALSGSERATATKAARGYRLWHKGQKKPPNPVSAQTFLRERDGWAQFVVLAPAPPVERPPPVFEVEGSPAWAARLVIARITETPAPKAQGVGDQRGCLFAGPLNPAQLALARFANDDPAAWQFVRSGGQQCGAWRAFFKIEPRQITVGYTTKEILGRIVTDWPVRETGLRVPCPWPPRKDGTISTGPPPDVLASDQDLKDFAAMG